MVFEFYSPLPSFDLSFCLIAQFRLQKQKQKWRLFSQKILEDPFLSFGMLLKP